MKYKDIKRRLDANSAIGGNEDDPCWVWIGAINKQGYGRINVQVGGKKICKHSHRVAFEEHKRKLADGEEVDHLCFNRACINPSHLEAVDKATNLSRRRY